MVEQIKTIENRILFPGNPWDRGHILEEFKWSGRLTRDGLIFDFHLHTDDYYAEDEDEDELDDETFENLGDWESKIVWSNYHHCTLSSTYWGEGNGIPVTDKKMISLEELEGNEYTADPLPIEDWDEPFAFQVYLLGHDSVADHSIQFVKRTAPFTYTIDWQGKIALTYAGRDEFEYSFQLRKTEVELAFIDAFDFESEAKAREQLKRLVKEAAQFDCEAEESSFRFILNTP